MSTEASGPQLKNSMASFFGGHVLDVRGIFARRWPLVAAGCGLGLVLGIVYFVVATPRYESRSEIIVMLKNSSMATRTGDRASDVESQASEELLATHMELIQSPLVVGLALQRAVKSEQAAQLTGRVAPAATLAACADAASDASPGSEPTEAAAETAPQTLADLQSILEALGPDEDAVTYVIEHMSVSRGGSGQAKTANKLNVSFRHTSPEDAQLVLKAIVREYESHLAKKYLGISNEAVDLKEKERQTLEEETAAAERTISQLQERSQLIRDGESVRNPYVADVDQLRQALRDNMDQYDDTRARLLVVREAYADWKTRGGDEMELLALLGEKHSPRMELLVTVDRGAADSEVFMSTHPHRAEGARVEYEGLLTLRLKEKTLMANLGDQHPELQDVRDQIELTEATLAKKAEALGIDEVLDRLNPAKVVDVYTKLLEYDLTSLESRRAEIDTRYNRAYRAMKGVENDETQLVALREEVDRKRKVLEGVYAKLSDINFVRDFGGFVVDPIRPAELGEKVAPDLFLSLLMGLAVGLVVGGGGAVAADFHDRSFRTPDEIRDALELPVLSHLPVIKPQTALAAKAPASASGAKLHETVVAFYKPMSRDAEVFRGLRTSLFFSGRGRRQQVISFTSPNAGDGKTTLVSNLAVSIAQSGKKVLLVDCDMRRARVHQMFGLDGDAGLSRVISGEIEPTDAIRETPVENLFAIPCGPRPANPAELLTSQMFEQFLSVMRDRFDYVLLDCPPLLAVADPCIVAQQADAVVMTVRVSRDSRPQAVQARNMLHDVGANVIGVVVNGGEQGQGYGYGYGYGYSYNYKYSYGYGTYGYGPSSVYYKDEGGKDGPGTRDRVPARDALSGEAPPTNGSHHG